MTDTPASDRKKAFEVPCGNAVIVESDGVAVVCMKAEREGKEYIHHYAVPLHPCPETETALIYLDPDDEIVDCATAITFTVREADEAAKPDVGEVFRSVKGTFMKVHEDPVSQKMYAYLNLETGQIMRRQEKRLEAVYREWTAADGDGTLTLVALHERHVK